jgi:hypothetical protein
MPVGKHADVLEVLELCALFGWGPVQRFVDQSGKALMLTHVGLSGGAPCHADRKLLFPEMSFLVAIRNRRPDLEVATVQQGLALVSLLCAMNPFKRGTAAGAFQHVFITKEFEGPILQKEIKPLTAVTGDRAPLLTDVAPGKAGLGLVCSAERSRVQKRLAKLTAGVETEFQACMEKCPWVVLNNKSERASEPAKTIAVMPLYAFQVPLFDPVSCELRWIRLPPSSLRSQARTVYKAVRDQQSRHRNTEKETMKSEVVLEWDEFDDFLHGKDAPLSIASAPEEAELEQEALIEVAHEKWVQTLTDQPTATTEGNCDKAVRHLRECFSDASTASGTEVSVAAATSEASRSVGHIQPCGQPCGIVGRWWWTERDVSDSFVVKRSDDGSIVWEWDGPGGLTRQPLHNDGTEWRADGARRLRLHHAGELLHCTWFMPGEQMRRVRCSAARSCSSMVQGAWKDVEEQHSEVQVLGDRVSFAGSWGQLTEDGLNEWTVTLRGGRYDLCKMYLEVHDAAIWCCLVHHWDGEKVAWAAEHSTCESTCGPPAKRLRVI